MLQSFQTYQLARSLYRQCEGIKTRANIRDQLVRAALSVVLNVAEGSAKPTAKERRRFYSISLASLREVQAILDLLGDRETFAFANRVGGCLYRLSRPKRPDQITGRITDH